MTKYEAYLIRREMGYQTLDDYLKNDIFVQETFSKPHYKNIDYTHYLRENGK